MTENTRGALYMMAAMTAFTTNDAIVKLLAQDLPLFQVIFLRGCLASLFLGLLAWQSGAFRFQPSRRDLWVVSLRSVVEVGAAIPFFIALTQMPLANVSAILQVLPLAVTFAGALFLGEQVGWRRWAAIGFGFLGVLLIIRPGVEGFNIYALVVLIAVVAVTTRDLLTRGLSPDFPSLLAALGMSVVVMLVGLGITLTQDWHPVSGASLMGLGASAVFIVAAYAFSVLAMRHGDVGAVAPFRYTSLLVALILGWALFGDWPDGVTLLGAAIVVGSGLFTILREASLRRRR